MPLRACSTRQSEAVPDGSHGRFVAWRISPCRPLTDSNISSAIALWQRDGSCFPWSTTTRGLRLDEAVICAGAGHARYTKARRQTARRLVVQSPASVSFMFNSNLPACWLLSCCNPPQLKAEQTIITSSTPPCFHCSLPTPAPPHAPHLRRTWMRNASLSPALGQHVRRTGTGGALSLWDAECGMLRPRLSHCFHHSLALCSASPHPQSSQCHGPRHC